MHTTEQQHTICMLDTQVLTYVMQRVPWSTSQEAICWGIFMNELLILAHQWRSHSEVFAAECANRATFGTRVRITMKMQAQCQFCSLKPCFKTASTGDKRQ